MEYDKIIDEFNRCITCNNKPCQEKCPLNNDVTGFIKLVKQGEYKKAYELLCETSVLQPLCGRICPHEKQCKSNCTRKYKSEAIEIGELESFIGDMAIEKDWEIPMISDDLKGKKVAVIGSGPAGLTCAAFLRREGAEVTIYEKREELGGLLLYGIPDFRLDKDILRKQISKIISLGINVKTNIKLGIDISLNDLEKEYDAVFIGIGANVPKKINTQGAKLDGVYCGNELLEYGNFPNCNGKVTYVCGGGNVAIDTARTVKRLGAKEVTIVYRRSEEEMPAEKKEIKEAKEEDINFIFHTNIIKIKGNNEVCGIECIKTEYNEEAKLVNIKDTNYDLSADYVFMAVGAETDKEVLENLGLELTSNGNIKINEKNKTSKENVFAGGDLVGEKATVSWAARSGRNAACNIKEYLL